MLQQRFFDNFYFFACGFYFLIKFFLFFVQFSVHFLFFTCFFLLQKNTASFQFFIVAHPLTHLILFVFFFFLTESSGPVTVGCEPAKTWPLHGGPKAGTFASKNRSMGFCWFACVCVFLYGCVIFCFVFLSVCCFSLHLYTHM